eukprot:3980229-Amphidinium_carterae.1
MLADYLALWRRNTIWREVRFFGAAECVVVVTVAAVAPLEVHCSKTGSICLSVFVWRPQICEGSKGALEPSLSKQHGLEVSRGIFRACLREAPCKVQQRHGS